mmetsp:Transcript_7599/g.17768  ORF Transcript_7599/g.17768 Transcript_7599/m.17768 type:complete len:255 (+) Transcript_7599:39-803(+)
MCVLVSHCLLRDAAMLPASSTPPCRARCARTGDRVIHRYHRLDRIGPDRCVGPFLGIAPQRIGSIGGGPSAAPRRVCSWVGRRRTRQSGRSTQQRCACRRARRRLSVRGFGARSWCSLSPAPHRTAQRRTARPRGFAQASLLACLFGRWLGRFRPSLGGWCCCLVVVLVFGVVWWWWCCLVVCLECTAPGSNGTAMGGSSFAPSVSVSRGQSRPGWRSLPPLPACYAAAVSSSPLPLLQYYQSQDPGEGNRLLG